MSRGEVRTVLRQMAAITALSVAVAALFHLPLIKRFARGEFRDAFFLAEEFPGVRMIGAMEAEDLWAGGLAVFLDARPAFLYRAGRVPGARNVPFEGGATEIADELLAALSGRTVVVYCEEEDCRTSLELAKLLHDRGLQDLRVLAGGWDEWRRAGLPEEGDR